MSTRVVLNGRVWYQSREAVPRMAQKQRDAQGRLIPASVPLNRKGELLDGVPIPPESPVSPFRAGIPYRDEESGVIFRVVSKLDPQDGWASARFFMLRWALTLTQIHKLVHYGMLDAAIEEGSLIKRFRCRDERAVKASSVWLQAHPVPEKPKATRKRGRPENAPLPLYGEDEAIKKP